MFQFAFPTSLFKLHAKMPPLSSLFEFAPRKSLLPSPLNYDRETSVSLLFTSFTIHLLSKWFIRNGPPDGPNRNPDNMGQRARKDATKELNVRRRAV